MHFGSRLCEFPQKYLLDAAISPSLVLLFAPSRANFDAAAKNASSIFHGFAGLWPVSWLTISLYPIHVDGINCAGPMAPPQPYPGQHDIGVCKGSIPSSVVMFTKS